MKKNLLQQTLYEINQKKEIAGYQIKECEDGFIILWNNPDIYFYSKAHCEMITEKNYAFFKEAFPFPKLSIATDKRSPLEKTLPGLVFEETSDTMLFERATPLEESKQFKIKPVETKQDIEIFAEIACEVFHHPERCQILTESLTADLKVKHCCKYIGYIGQNAAGIVEFSEGKEAVFISWVAVKQEFRRQGLCHAMLAYAINREIEKNFTKFVLVSSSEGKIVYSLLGFKDFKVRYNYTLNCK